MHLVLMKHLKMGPLIVEQGVRHLTSQTSKVVNHEGYYQVSDRILWKQSGPEGGKIRNNL